MKILIIAPLPPPITGHSIVSKALSDALENKYTVDIVNLSKQSLKDGVVNIERIVEVKNLLAQVKRKSKQADVIYFTISESLAGNIKDLLIYFLCKNLNKLVIHLHGGSIKRLLWDNNQFIFSLNKRFIKKLGAVIISGKSHLPIFEDLINNERIHIVPNFASSKLLLSDGEVIDKFKNKNPLNVLYMSNLIKKKGYDELSEAFIALDDIDKQSIRINFAGAFDTDHEKQIFLDKIEKYPQLAYHGIINEEKKAELFKASHAFCLPTSYFEGQPISILEAYASGCVVLTTGQKGILDIFKDGENGFQIEEPTSRGVKASLNKLWQNIEQLQLIGQKNNILAREKYQQTAYTEAIEEIIKNLNNHK